jgi:hypothetical protein
MKRPTVKKLIARHAAAISRREPHRSTWRDCYRYAMPMRNIMDNPQPGQPKGDLVFDSTAINDLTTFANRIQSDLFPTFQDFFKLEPGPGIDEKMKEEAAKVLAEISTTVHAAIHHSNFSQSINEFLLELGIGTGIMLVQEGTDDDPLDFQAMTTQRMALEMGPKGRPGAIFRDVKIQISVIMVEWPDATLTDDMKKTAAETPETEVSLIEVTYPDWKAKKWFYEVIMPEGEHRLLEKPRVYEDNSPWIIARWVKAANEVWGRGPIQFALPDIRTANKVVELTLKNASLAVSGVYTGVDDGVLNPATARFVPGGIIPVARNQGHPQGASLTPLERAGNFDVSQLILEDLRMAIHKTMYNRSLPPDAGPVRSATEIIERMRELSVDIGAAFGRLLSELVEPLVLRCVQIMARMGKIAFPVKIDGTTIKITVTSPLAQTQKLTEVQNVVQWFGLMSQFGPQMAILSAKVEDVPAWMGRQLGVPEELIRTEEGRGTVQDIIGALVQQMMQEPGGAAQVAALAGEAAGGGQQ